MSILNKCLYLSLNLPFNICPSFSFILHVISSIYLLTLPSHIYSQNLISLIFFLAKSSLFEVTSNSNFSVQKARQTYPSLQTKDTFAPSSRLSGKSTRPLGSWSRKSAHDFTGEKGKQTEITLAHGE